jgi:hypothetical protein
MIFKKSIIRFDKKTTTIQYPNECCRCCTAGGFIDLFRGGLSDVKADIAARLLTRIGGGGKRRRRFTGKDFLEGHVGIAAELYYLVSI